MFGCKLAYLFQQSFDDKCLFKATFGPYKNSSSGFTTFFKTIVPNCKSVQCTYDSLLKSDMIERKDFTTFFGRRCRRGSKCSLFKLQIAFLETWEVQQVITLKMERGHFHHKKEPK